MSTIRELDSANSEYITKISELHIKAFPHFFLTQLGIQFLKALYNGYMEDKESGIIVAEDKGGLLGFIAYSKDYSGFYKRLIHDHLMKFAFCSLKAAIRQPLLIKRLLGAFKKSESVEKRENYVELASICVDPQIKDKGIGTALIEHLKSIVDFNKYAFINLETDAINNDSVNRFYINNGFVLARQFTTTEGRKMNEYKYTPGDKI